MMDVKGVNFKPHPGRVQALLMMTMGAKGLQELELDSGSMALLAGVTSPLVNEEDREAGITLQKLTAGSPTLLIA